MLVPGFLAGDGSLALMARSLRRQGFRTYRSRIRSNAGCTVGASSLLEQRLESIAPRPCRLDPLATAVEVATSHSGMAFDPRVVDEVVRALGIRTRGRGSMLEVDGGVRA